MDENIGRRFSLVVGFIVGVTVLFELTVLVLHLIGKLTANAALVSATVGSAVATVTLVLVIFFQSILYQEQVNQNEALINQNRKQSLILQESEWMPVGVFVHSGLQIKFLQNPPYMPRVRLVIEGKDSGWKVPGTGDIKSGDTERQIIGIGGVFDSAFSVDSGDHRGEFSVKFQSITGAEYRYEYEVIVNFDGGFSIPQVKNVRRKMPWGRVVE